MLFYTRTRLLQYSVCVATLGLFCLLYKSATFPHVRTEVAPTLKRISSSLTLTPAPQGNCSSHTSIAYIKTYKTASSTVQNIVFRFAEKHRLSLALPSRLTIFSTTQTIRRKQIFESSRHVGKYSVLANHGRYGPELHNLMKEDAKYITTIRDPTTQFESVYNYFKLDRVLEPLIEKFLEAPEPAYKAWLRRRPDYIARNLLKNPNMFSLGLESTSFDNQSAVLSKIEEIDSKFDLVMLADRLEESLILLKNLMCWSSDDVASLITNRRMQRTQLTSSQCARIRKWSSADTLLYEHFSRKFERQVQSFGTARMASEINELRERSEYWKDRCLTEGPGLMKAPVLGAYVKRLHLKEISSNCTRLVWTDNVYTAYLRRKAKLIYNTNNEHE